MAHQPDLVTRMRKTLLPLLSAALIAAACSGGPSEAFTGAEHADEFVEIMHRTGFQPLEVPSPETLLEEASETFRGRVIDVVEGPRQVENTSFAHSCEEDQAAAAKIEGEVIPDCTTSEVVLAFLQFTVVVVESFSDGIQRGDQRTFQLPVGPLDLDDALAVAPGGEIIVSLMPDDPEAFAFGTREWPNGQGDFHLAHPAGVWFPSEHDRRPIGPFLPVEALGPGWNQPEEFEDMADVLRQATPARVDERDR